MRTFKQSEEESLCVRDCDFVVIIRAGFCLELFSVVFVEEGESI